MNPITIRPFDSSDIRPCALWMASTPLWQRYGVTFDSASARLSTAFESGATILVAADSSSAALGFVWVVLRGAFDISGYIRLIGVDPAQRSRGIGKLLLTAAEDVVRPAAKDMFLLCSDFNLDAQKFYLREGYQQVGALPDYVLPGITELIFRKRLVGA